jgi:hypothetical protein
MVSLDIYLNETTRHADVVRRPVAGSPALRRRFGQFAIRNVATGCRRCSRRRPGSNPSGGRPASRRDRQRSGRGDGSDALDDFVLLQQIGHEVAAAESPIYGRDPEDPRQSGAAPRTGAPADFMLARGHGDGRTRPDGLTPAGSANPHGVDFGPLEARVRTLRTPSGKIEPRPSCCSPTRSACGPTSRVTATARTGRPARPPLEQLVDAQPAGAREGRPARTIHVRRTRAAWPADGGHARDVARRHGEHPGRVTDAIMPGVAASRMVSHDLPDVRLKVAAAHAGVNSNRLTDELALDPLWQRRPLRHPVTVEPAA